ERYFRVIEKKTAKLFEAACQLGAVLSGRRDIEVDLAAYGKSLGVAFQVMDDILDYTGDDGKLGKNVGDDLAEGKPTLPLILCRQNLEREDRRLVDKVIREGDEAHFERIIELIGTSGALRRSRQRARAAAANAKDALEGLERSDWSEAMNLLADYSINREF
ncbi:MAG: polyprenyl synthetase family protein, partial [Xanthomonadales bacterium]|nr:polyprenyl synthetase family protein [Xanthomonadales bacterium]